MDRLCQLAEAELDALAAEGINPSAAEVVLINALASRVDTPVSRIALSRGKPFLAGRVYLWPNTLEGADWYKEVGGKFAGQDAQTLALGFAMAHAYDPNFEWPMEEKDAERRVRAWGKTLGCRLKTLSTCICQVVNHDEMPDATDETGQRATAGEISLMLAAMTKTDPAIWERQCSMTYALAMLDTLIAQNAADGHSTKHDPRIKAERALGLVIARIRKEHKEARQEKAS